MPVAGNLLIKVFNKNLHQTFVEDQLYLQELPFRKSKSENREIQPI